MHQDTLDVSDIFKHIGNSLIFESKISDPSSLLEENPVDVRTFINSPDYLNIGKSTYSVVQHDLENMFNGTYKEAVLLEGIGGGKSTCSSIAICYMLYRTLIIRDPVAYYQLQPGSKIAFMNMSTSATQAKKIVFGRVAAMINGSKWFREHYLPDNKVTSELRFSKDIYVIPGSSSETAPIGYDILGAVMDEAAFMTESKHSGIIGLEENIHSAAEEIYNSMIRRIESRFSNHSITGFKGLMLIISSPRWKGDFVCKKFEEAKNDKEIYARRRATFDCKPNTFYCGSRFIINIERKEIILSPDKEVLIINDNHPYYNNDKNLITVPVEYLKSFKRNMTKSLRDICAIASRAVTPYITNFSYWKEVAESSGLVDPYNHNTNRFEDWFKGNNLISTVHVDLATGKQGRDACGIALACRNPSSNKIIVPFIAAIRDLKNGIDFSKIREIIETLKQIGFNIKWVTYDGWQSIESRQVLEKRGFHTEELSVDRTMEPYETLKESVNSGNVIFLNYPIFLEEVEGLELVEGKKVDHPEGLSKDTADAVAGAVYTLITKPTNSVSVWVS
jgi:hypothetical protein